MHWHWFHPLIAHPGPGVAFLALAALAALAVDRLWGEPPARWHPVVWMGRALGACGRWVAPTAPMGRDLTCFWLAALYWCALAAIVLIVSVLLQAAVLYVWGAPAGVSAVVMDVPGLGQEGASAVVGVLRLVLAALLLGLLLKPLFAFRLLLREVCAVEDALARSLDTGRARLAWLVSRDVAQLSADEVRQSAIESLAENLNDSVVAPLFWFAVAGLPGAALYRLANTADAMWGYRGMRDGRYWEWAGKWAARADDVLSWLPARITALLLALVGGGVRLRGLAREARQTPSPNSGWPMAAMALALGVRLTKPGVYQLHAQGRAPTARDVGWAQEFALKVALTLAGIAATAIVIVVIQGAWSV
ncbi:MAG: adenosylcobinamide-phosphate synthase CbiB [Giesbergeria sp.]|jgi:adenosylcobinamide-phosphate synthase|nr:adenosylcobinamide-phosphate synthase CbiB [Giesbergeria sp.]